MECKFFFMQRHAFHFCKKKYSATIYFSVYYSVGHLKEKSWRQFSMKWCLQQHTIVHKRLSLSECWANAPSFPVNDFGTIKHICCISPEEARKHWTTQRTHWFSYSCQRWINFFYLCCETKHVALDSCSNMAGITSPEYRAAYVTARPSSKTIHAWRSSSSYRFLP